MKLSDFDYNLPQELIAQTPIEPRDHSRLLTLEKTTGEIKENKFFSILNELGPNDVLVLNKTKVINARLKGYIEKDNKIVEIFLHKQINDKTWDCLIYPGKKLKPGTNIYFKNNNLVANIISFSDSGRIVQFNKSGLEFLEIIEKLGEVPLPPYIKEKLENKERYQTIFNEVSGSVAAPTAGLHFTPELLQKLEEKGVKIEKVVLHVGLGTFGGIKDEDYTKHSMHSEYIEIDKKTAEKLNDYKKNGKRIIAVGTTSVRVLESFTNNDGILEYGNKETNIFIYPGYKWKFIDSIITNFHLPKSSLLLLVSSFAGKENIDKSYKYATKNKFRFFSFGDVMWIK